MNEIKHASKGDGSSDKRRWTHRQPRSLRTAGFPDAGDANYRVICNEIAEQLSKNWRFKIQVVGLVVTAFIAVAAAVGALVGWSLSNALATERQHFQQDAQKQIGAAREEIERQIADQFKNENVQKTVEAAAAAEASRLLAKSVDPSIKSFQSKIDDVTARVDRRSQELEGGDWKDGKGCL